MREEAEEEEGVAMFCAHKGSEEPVGTWVRAIWRDKTDAEMISRAAKLWPDGFTVYRFIGKDYNDGQFAPLTDGASWRLIWDGRRVR